MRTQSIIRLNSKILPILLVVFFIMQILDASKVWVALLVGLGLAFLVSFLWISSLAQHLALCARCVLAGRRLATASKAFHAGKSWLGFLPVG